MTTPEKGSHTSLVVLWLGTVVVFLGVVASLVLDRRTLSDDNDRLRAACGLAGGGK